MGKLKWAKAESIKVHAVRGSVWRRVSIGGEWQEMRLEEDRLGIGPGSLG